MRFAHISDTHFDGGDRALSRVRRVMDYLRGMPLDAILVSGDIADHGAIAEYEQAKAELTADVPVLLLPGNHDDRSAYRKVLTDDEVGGDTPINTAVEVGGAIFALCDSSVPGRDDGRLAPETRAWLRDRLEETDRPVFICLHHPPVTLHNPLIDEIRLGNPDDLALLISEYPQAVAVLCGHAHTAGATTFAGLPLLVAPGVVSTLRLPWAIDKKLTWKNTMDFEDDPGVAFHVFEDGRLTTHYRTVPGARRGGLGSRLVRSRR